MKKTSCFSRFQYFGFARKRVVWQNPPEKYPDAVTQREFAEVADLVKKLQVEKEDTSQAKEAVVKAIVDKLLSYKGRYFSPELLGQLASRKEVDIRRAVATSPRTPPAILGRMATDPDPFVRYEAGKNSKTPSAALEMLAFDDPNLGLMAVSLNPAVPQSLLEKIANHTNADVRFYAACSPFSSISILRRLSSDSDKFVRDEALRHLKGEEQ